MINYNIICIIKQLKDYYTTILCLIKKTHVIDYKQ